MDQGTGEHRQEVDRPDGSGQEHRPPREIRHDIEETRGELGDTVEALAEKADIRSQAKQRVRRAKQAAQQRKEQLKASSPVGATAGVQHVATHARENPLPWAAAAALAIGFLLGRRGR